MVSLSGDKVFSCNDKWQSLCLTPCIGIRRVAMAEYRVPGVFIEALAKLPPAVAEVETALPAFIGYTAQATLSRSGDLLGVPHRIRSLVEFEACYGIGASYRSEEHTSELQSHHDLVCRLLLEKKKKKNKKISNIGVQKRTNKVEQMKD